MFPITVPSTFSVIAHRGASGYAPENTLPAFELAVRMGAVEFEFDCQLASDGAVVVCHDPTLERFGYPEISIAATPSGRLCRLDMGSWLSPFLHSAARMPLLGEIFDTFGNQLTYHVELKSEEPQLAEAVLEEIAARSLVDNCVVISFHQALLAHTRDLHETIRLGWDVAALDDRVLGLARELDLAELNPSVARLTESQVETAHGFVEEVLVWGIEGTPQQVLRQIEQAVALGCDGAFLNWPDRAVQSAT
jgi:glycerophosphoryl diester phosphodiesterase